MAKVLNPLYSSDAKGSIGGLTFSSGPVGNIVKIKPGPVKRAEPYKQSNRARIAYLARQWGELEAAERTSWEAWAAEHPEPDGFGGTFIMSGINAFVKLNFNAMRLGAPGDMQSLPPEDPSPASLDTLTAATGVGAAGDIDLTWTHNGTGEADDYNEIQIAGPFQSQGRKIVFNHFHFIQTEAGNVLLDTISGLDEGMWYWVRVRYVDEFGQTTPYVYAQATPMLTV